jgi:hypothetical protein
MIASHRDALGRCSRQPGAHQLYDLLDAEAVCQHDRLDAAVAA